EAIVATKEVWVRFKIGDAFPADSMVARFVTGLALIEIDLLSANVAMLSLGAREDIDSSPEVTALFWDAAAGLREAVKFVADAAKHPLVVAFVNTLPADAQAAFSEILSAGEPWQGSF